MEKLSIQYHATHEDILEFISAIDERYVVGKVILFPDFKVVEVGKEAKAAEIEDADMLVISKSNIQQSDDYNSFIKMQDNNLVIRLGKEHDNKLYESSMFVWTERELDNDFVKIIKSFKKQMRRGAWVLNPNSGVKKYYNNLLYTDRARQAYEKGVTICPIAGWNLFELTNDDKML